jgi:uncharacterized repeat protein (TIGR01451 family)
MPSLADPGDVLNYTITLRSAGSGLPNARVTDTLPAEVRYLGDLWASRGSYSESGGAITWTGDVPAGEPVTITFGARVREEITHPQAIVNTAFIDDGLGHVWQAKAVAIVNGYPTYLPMIKNE